MKTLPIALAAASVAVLLATAAMRTETGAGSPLKPAAGVESNSHAAQPADAPAPRLALDQASRQRQTTGPATVSEIPAPSVRTEEPADRSRDLVGAEITDLLALAPDLKLQLQRALSATESGGSKADREVGSAEDFAAALRNLDPQLLAPVRAP